MSKQPEAPDELDQIFYQALRGKTVTPEQAHILEWAEARLKPSLLAREERLVREARIDELVHAELAMAGNDESEGIEYRIDRFKELGADRDYVVHCATCGKLNLNQFGKFRPEHEEYCQCD